MNLETGRIITSCSWTIYGKDTGTSTKIMMEMLKAVQKRTKRAPLIFFLSSGRRHTRLCGGGSRRARPQKVREDDEEDETRKNRGCDADRSAIPVEARDHVHPAARATLGRRDCGSERTAIAFPDLAESLSAASPQAGL